MLEVRLLLLGKCLLLLLLMEVLPGHLTHHSTAHTDRYLLHTLRLLSVLQLRSHSLPFLRVPFRHLLHLLLLLRLLMMMRNGRVQWQSTTQFTGYYCSSMRMVLLLGIVLLLLLRHWLIVASLQPARAIVY